MGGTKRMFLDYENFGSLDTTPVNVNLVKILPLTYHVSHDGTTLGLQELSLRGVAFEEVIFASIDLPENIGKYAVDPITNSIWLIADKLVVGDIDTARNYIVGLLISYQMVNLAYLTDAETYSVVTISANGTQIGATGDSLNLSAVVSKISCLDSNLNLNGTQGYYTHIVTRSMKLSGT
jgi:hypothetical protein